MFSKLTLFAVGCLFFSCSFNNTNELKIDFSSDRTTILLTQVNEVSLFRAKEQKDQLQEELVCVFEIGGDSGLEKHVSGRLLTKGDTVIFVPAKPFVKGRQYEVSTILNSSFGNAEDLLKTDIGKSVKRQQKLLVR